jgi:hypothetical protein
MTRRNQWEPFYVALRRGDPLACTAEQWHGGLRGAVQDYAAKMADQGQSAYAWVALEEVRRNDARFGSGLEIEPA